jgi:hypothetical protein
LNLAGEQLNLRDAANDAIELAQVVESVRAKHLALTSRDADLKGRELYGLPPEPGTTA